MEIWGWLIITVLAAAVVLLAARLWYLKKSAREIREAFVEKTENDTNTLITISGHDRDMRALAETMNEQLKRLGESRLKYERGDLELKEAITNISHDLRTPLTAVYGYLRLLKTESEPEAVREYLSAVENRVRAMRQLTEELFRYTVAVSDESEPELADVDVNGALEECISSYYAVLKERGIEPVISMPDEKVVRRLNADALSRILGNIMSNAVKYSDGDLDITLTVEGEITFANHAQTLSEVQTARLFDRFYTVDSARRSTGLGLSIARLLTEEMGGTIGAVYLDGRISIKVSFPGRGFKEPDVSVSAGPAARGE